MGILSRSIFREVFSGTLLGSVLFTFVLFLQRLGRLFEILVRSSAAPATVGSLFALSVPATLVFTIPLGVLVGTLIALSRMAGDAEITALRAAGVPTRRVIAPVMLLAFCGFAVTATASLWLTPYSLWKTDRILHQMVASELTAEVEPRIFEEQFPNTVLYVKDVTFAAQTKTGPVYKWRNIFMADLTPPETRNTDGHERGDAPRITVAAQALAIPDVAHNRIQLSLINGSTHEVTKDVTQYISTSFPRGEQLLEAQRPSEVQLVKAVTEIDTLPLFRMAYRDKTLDPDKLIESRIEFQQRLALPPACLILALLGIPLGVSSRKGGKSTAFVVTLALAFLYNMGFITLLGLAKQRALPVGVAVWLPNAVFSFIALLLLLRLDVPGDRDWIGVARSGLRTLTSRFRVTPPPLNLAPRLPFSFAVLPQVLDTYVLTSFLFYLGILLTSFVMMTEVFTFFELLSDIIKNHIPMYKVASYLFFLGPKLIYDSTPVSVLVAVLITFGILTKHNEVTAFLACGVSVYRLAVPIIVASAFLSGGLFAFDHYYVPEANRKQDALRNEIKGRPVQTYLRADRKWIFGEDSSRIYYYKYLDPVEHVMAGVNVYELDPSTYRLRRQISAERAHWEPHLHTWVFENGWMRQFLPSGERLMDFAGRAETFPEINEPPGWFLKEVIESKQMNFVQLSSYIRELQQSGFDTVALRVQFYRKFSVPLFALIMALISTPFAFLAGNRGAMAGVGVSLGIAIAYFTLNILFEQVGNVNLLPASFAAWSPDLLFALSGMYFFTRMKT